MLQAINTILECTDVSDSIQTKYAEINCTTCNSFIFLRYVGTVVTEPYKGVAGFGFWAVTVNGRVMAAVKTLQLTLVISQLFALGWGLKIMSFNIKDFGEQRYEQQNVTDVIVKASFFFLTQCWSMSALMIILLQLIADYDISLLLEIMDSHGDVVPGLQKQVNR